MADLQRHSLVEKDADQVKAIAALKKGAQLLKYGRRGKPKFCPFRLSSDESTLTWYYGKYEKQLELRHVSRIIPGQRTPIFQRYPRPEKEYQSFSLIYKDRSLDLVCKDKAEAEVWFSSLKALILRGVNRKQKNESKSENAVPDSRPLFRRVASSSPSSPRDQKAPNACPEKNPSKRRLCKAFSDVFSYTATTSKIPQPIEVISSPLSPLNPSGVPECSPPRTSSADITVRISHSSALSSSSQGSCTDDHDSMGGVFLWGEGIGEGFMGGGTTRAVGSSISKIDSLLPKALDLLDVQSVACGRRHTALVTKQGEIFSWGEEEGGRLGHGVDSDISHPKLIQTLSGEKIEMVACGEYHTCAVTNSGDLYTWGSGDVGHWIPKRIGGPIAGLHVAFVSCGPWHTAVVTSFGQLFTFGDGTFGALGHGDRGCSYVPREVESLKGMKTVKVACGVWHTAAIVELTLDSNSDSEQQQQPSDKVLGGKLFTWGDGDKGKLGHSHSESRLVPECVSSLANTDFCQVACGDSLTVALTTSGRVFTMGSTIHGQLGSPLADGKTPFWVRGKISNSFIQEIACGSHHVAVLNSKSDVYTWGKGSNGQLGHGDIEDRNIPTLVESLKDKQVKSISCGSNFTAVVSLHKWTSTVNNSACSGCRYPFNLIRKRHNCYNCGLVFCKACTSRKSLKASLALYASKPYRVCDVCFVKLENVAECVRVSSVRKPDETVEKDGKWSISRLSSVNEFAHNMKFEFGGDKCLFLVRVGNGGTTNVADQRPSTSSKSPTSTFKSSRSFRSHFVPDSRRIPRSTSPVPRKIPLRSTTLSPPTTLPFRVSGVNQDDLKGESESLGLEIKSLRTQVESITGKSQLLEAELEKKTKLLEKIIAQAADEAEKSKAANDVIKSLTAQLKEMSEKVRMDEQVDNYHGRPSNGSSVTSVKSEPTDNSNTAQIPNRDKSQAQKTKQIVQDEPGVYITLVTFPNGVNELRRVRFSRKRFTEEQAEKWWAENETRVLERHNVESCNRNS